MTKSDRKLTVWLRVAVLGLVLAAPVAAQDKVVINDRWPIRGPNGHSELSPPQVEQTNECSTSVYVDGFVPRAIITVFRGGTTIIGGPFVTKFGFADVPVTAPLHTGEKITALQEVNGVKSAQSAIMVVGKMPSTLPRPTIEPKIYACGRIVPVHNLVPGVTVEVRDLTASAVIGTGATPNLWGGDWDPVLTSKLVKSNKITAKQSACTGAMSLDALPVAVLADPSPVNFPTFDTPIIGNDTITAHGLYIGSLFQAFQPGSIGSALSTATSNWMEVATIKAAPGVTMGQDLCTPSKHSPPVTPTNDIPAPTLVGPICPGQPGAIVRNTTINATLVLMKGGSVVGYGGAGPGDVPLDLAPPAAFAENDVIQVVEYIGSNVVFSNTITVGCTNTITYHNVPQRTGWNQSENTLTPANVKPGTFGFITKVILDDQVDTQPLVVTNQEIEGQGIHTAVYVATEGNTVYAIDSWSGGILNHVNLGPPVPAPLGCNNNGPNVGINGTPTIDATTHTMYVIAYTLIGGNPAYQLHALDLSTLKDKPGSPVPISPTHGAFSFTASVQRQRSALLLTHGNLYAAFASFCDFLPDQSRGWVLGWNAGTLAPLSTNELTNTRTNTWGVCNAGSKQGNACTKASDCPGGACKPFYLSSIWMSGYGVAADTSGNVFFATGNSDWTKDTYTGTTNIQESVVKMPGDLSKVDLFTPSNVFTLDQGDTDLGSGGVMVLPDQPGPVPRLAVAAGKDGRNFILNRDKMGGFHNPDIPKNVFISPCWCGPSYYQGSDGVGRVVSSGGFQAQTWKVNTALSPALTHEASSASLPPSPQTDGGFFTTVSSDGTKVNTAIIWAVARPTGKDNHVTLFAFNGTASGGSLAGLWSGPAGTWPNTGTSSNPFTISGDADLVPTVANGRVYVPSYGQMQIFGLIGKTRGAAAPRRFEQITEAPTLPKPVNRPGAAYWGVIKSVNGGIIVITLRTGQALQVDLSPAMKAGTMIHPVVGVNVAANGTLNAQGILQARTLTRAKGPASWGVDTAK